jgi:hypothetical protein
LAALFESTTSLSQLPAATLVVQPVIVVVEVVAAERLGFVPPQIVAKDPPKVAD